MNVSTEKSTALMTDWISSGGAELSRLGWEVSSCNHDDAEIASASLSQVHVAGGCAGITKIK